MRKLDKDAVVNELLSFKKSELREFLKEAAEQTWSDVLFEEAHFFFYRLHQSKIDNNKLPY